MSLYVFRPRRSQSGTMPSWGILTASMKIVNTSCAVRNYSHVSFSARSYLVRLTISMKRPCT